jgi:hypothetical protein
MAVRPGISQHADLDDADLEPGELEALWGSGEPVELDVAANVAVEVDGETSSEVSSSEPPVYLATNLRVTGGKVILVSEDGVLADDDLRAAAVVLRVAYIGPGPTMTAADRVLQGGPPDGEMDIVFPVLALKQHLPDLRRAIRETEARGAGALPSPPRTTRRGRRKRKR